MPSALDETVTLTCNQKRIVVLAAVSTGLEYSDCFIVGIILAFIVTPWKMTLGEPVVAVFVGRGRNARRLLLGGTSPAALPGGAC